MNLVVIGAQWGDEGKGKIVDYLAEKGDIVVRFSGGANAGHTIKTGDKVFKLHLVPSGIIYPDSIAILGTGMVIDPIALFKELDSIESQGVSWKGRLLISDRAHIVFPEYRDEDSAMDAKRIRPIGTTGRGIGVAFAQKAARDGIRVIDMYDPEVLNNLHPSKRAFVEEYSAKMKSMVANAAWYLHENKTKNILFEGAQGALLDLDNGTYPFVSSGFSCSAGASQGGGVGPRHLDNVMGVFKAYSTRVGNGPFPSEFKKDRDGDLDNIIREIGHEYGVTTGRPRRCGYLDLVALKYSCWVNSLDSLVLTHLDVYDTFDEIKVCVGYEIQGKTTEIFPASISELNAAKPVLKSFKGWKSPLSGCKSFDSMPKEARDYVDFIEKYAETKVSIISVGADRKETFYRMDPWKK
jgi:adenylosuccinate synthase